MIRVCTVQAETAYTLRLTFDSGECKRFDASPYLDYPVFRPLRDPNLFGLARVAYGTVEWPGEIDFAPETLYALSTPV